MPTLPDSVTVQCGAGNDFDGRLGVRISSIFVILITSGFGALFPILARNIKSFPAWPYFIARYFGSGVIVATAFIHLLAPANEALGSPCLEGFAVASYPFVEGIALMTVFLMFFIEFLAMRFATFGHDHSDSSADSHGHDHGHTHSHRAPSTPILTPTTTTTTSTRGTDTDIEHKAGSSSPLPRRPSQGLRGDDHLGHTREHEDSGEDYASQLIAIAILDFGVIFHSIFIGLTLAVSGAEFTTLYVVLVFHQMFEGLGLGSRLAVVPWPAHRRWSPYALGLAYAFSTPVAVAIGLGVRTTYAPGSYTALVTNGVFDSISAGILLYTGLVELMAHEFMFSEVMRKAKLGTVLSAFGLMALGAGLMALLGKWA